MQAPCSRSPTSEGICSTSPVTRSPRAALEFAEDRIHFAWGQHLEEDDPTPTHGSASTDLQDPAPAGPWRIGDAPPYATNDYLFTVDPAWSADHLGAGTWLATGRFRDGGWSGMGPALYAYQVPLDDTPPGTTLDSVPLIQYDTSLDGGSSVLDGYHHSDEWAGGAWLSTGDTSAVVFAGTKGRGDCWYGFENGVVWPEGGPYPDVPPAPFDARGWWSSEFEAVILFYDPSDLAAVETGLLESSEPQPYAILSIEDTLLADRRVTTPGRIGGIAYDPGSGFLYVMELHADGAHPVVHVWAIG
ncbi:hypothetical protein HQ535_06940 [bacterium]|nr:hypothetical protein [bacterium]